MPKGVPQPAARYRDVSDPPSLASMLGLMRRIELLRPALALLCLSCACDTKVPAGKTQAPATASARSVAAPSVTPARSEEVTFERAGLALEGTLERPKGEGPFPGVVLIHGSGPHSRDQKLPGQLGIGFDSPIPVFKQLAKQLAAQGIAVLRYDKRSCFSANGCNNKYPTPSETLVIEDFAEDAIAGLQYLGNRPDIDAKRLVIVGHSQGAGLVPMIMQRMPTLFGGVALAPAGNSFAATLDAQVKKAFTLVPESQHALVKAQMKPLSDDLEKIRDLEAGKEVTTPILGAPAAFMKSQILAARQSLELAATMDRPIWALRGTYDWNIPPSDFDQWRKALSESAHASKHKVIDLPDVSHALNKIHQKDPTKLRGKDIESSVHPSVASAIVELINTSASR